MCWRSGLMMPPRPAIFRDDSGKLLPCGQVAFCDCTRLSLLPEPPGIR